MRDNLFEGRKVYFYKGMINNLLLIYIIIDNMYLLFYYKILFPVCDTNKYGIKYDPRK